MLKSKSFCVAITIIGACLFCGALVLNFMFKAPDSAVVLLIGTGSALFGIGLPGLINKHYERTRPEMMKQYQIEVNDERNTMIRNKAKAISGDIIQWLILGIAYIALAKDVPLWLFFALVGVFLLKNILDMIFSIKYQKEL